MQDEVLNAATGASERAISSEGGGDGRKPRERKPREKLDEVCNDYLDGKCRYGDYCRRQHPVGIPQGPVEKTDGKVVRYRASVKGIVRAEADLYSENVGNLEKGEELQVVEMKMVDGKERARFLKSNTTNGGWVSVLAKSGRPVLTLLD